MTAIYEQSNPKHTLFNTSKYVDTMDSEFLLYVSRRDLTYAQRAQVRFNWISMETLQNQMTDEENKHNLILYPDIQPREIVQWNVKFSDAKFFFLLRKRMLRHLLVWYLLCHQRVDIVLSAFSL